MDINFYNRINKNTLICWLIINLVLIFSCIIETLKGFRNISYVLIFSIIAIVPLLITYIYYKKNKNGKDNIKYFFAIGNMIFYTFIVFTSISLLSFVYLIPMILILLVYSDKKINNSVFLYAIIINSIKIYLNYKSFFIYNEFIINNKEMIIFWEVQITCLALSLIFLHKATTFIKLKEEVIIDLMNDVYCDPLTGLYNIRFLENKIKPLVNYCDNLSIAFIDVDDFKQFNTLYGHKFGDEVLITIGKNIKKFINDCSNTYAIRVGGDEFVVISLSLDKDSFVSVLEKIRKQIEISKLIYKKNNVGICITIGISNSKVDKDAKNDFVTLYDLADKRNLYAKEKGKNKIVAE